jgi:hypothetical protein
VRWALEVLIVRAEFAWKGEAVSDLETIDFFDFEKCAAVSFVVFRVGLANANGKSGTCVTVIIHANATWA